MSVLDSVEGIIAVPKPLAPTLRDPSLVTATLATTAPARCAPLSITAAMEGTTVLLLDRPAITPELGPTRAHAILVTQGMASFALPSTTAQVRVVERTIVLRLGPFAIILVRGPIIAPATRDIKAMGFFVLIVMNASASAVETIVPRTLTVQTLRAPSPVIAFSDTPGMASLAQVSPLRFVLSIKFPHLWL